MHGSIKKNDYSGIESSPTGNGYGVRTIVIAVLGIAIMLTGNGVAVTVWHANLFRIRLNKDF